MVDFIMALDQGTTSSRCLLFDRNARIVSSAQKEFAQHYPNPGWVEHDPNEIWSSQISVAAEAMGKIQTSPSEIAGIGITNQRETTIVWNRATGQAVYPAIVWQCRRTAERIGQIEPEMEEYIKKTTGLIPDAYFSATKIAWILENVPGAAEAAERGELAFGTVDSWLIYHLTGKKVHVTDVTNASRTMLFDIHKMEWDEKLCRYFHIPMSMLPEVRPSSCVYGVTDPQIFGTEVPISGAAGDQQCALFGQCCFEAGEVKNTYGTGGFLLMNTGEKAVESRNGLLTTVAASAGEKKAYALEGSVFISGAGIQWLRDEMGLIGSSPESEVLAGTVENNGGVYIVPAFTGLGAPWWDPYARGTIVGLTRGSSKAHLVRAMLEAMAYQTYDLIGLMIEESGMPIRSLKIDGGASANNLLAQFQADICGCDVIRPACVETTGMGAAFLAGLACGFWKDAEELKGCIQEGRSFHPAMAEEERQTLLKGWEKAVRCAKFWAVEE